MAQSVLGNHHFEPAPAGQSNAPPAPLPRQFGFVALLTGSPTHTNGIKPSFKAMATFGNHFVSLPN